MAVERWVSRYDPRRTLPGYAYWSGGKPGDTRGGIRVVEPTSSTPSTGEAIVITPRTRRSRRTRPSTPSIVVVPSTPTPSTPEQEVTPEVIDLRPKPTLFQRIKEKPTQLLSSAEQQIREKLKYTPPKSAEPSIEPGAIRIGRQKQEPITIKEGLKMEALAIQRGIVTAPFTIARVGYGLVTSPIKTTKEVVTGFKELPKAFVQDPIGTSGEFLGQLIFSEAVGGALAKTSTKVKSIKSTQKYTPKVEFEIAKTKAVKTGTTPTGLSKWSVEVESRIRTYNPKTGKQVGKTIPVKTFVKEVSAKTESGAIKSAYEGYTTSLRTGLRTYAKEGKITSKFDIATGKGTATLSPSQVEGLYRGTAKAGIESYGEIGISVKPYTREISIATREYMIKPKAEALSNFIVKEAGMKPKIQKVGKITFAGEEYTAGIKSVTDIFKTKYKVKGYTRAKEPVIDTISKVQPYLRGFAKEQKGFRVGSTGIGKAFVPKEAFINFERIESPLAKAKLTRTRPSTEFTLDSTLKSLAEGVREKPFVPKIQEAPSVFQILKPAVKEQASALAVGRAFAEQSIAPTIKALSKPVIRTTTKKVTYTTPFSKFSLGIATGLGAGVMGVSGRKEVQDFQRSFGGVSSATKEITGTIEGAKPKTKTITSPALRTAVSTAVIPGLTTGVVQVPAQPLIPITRFPTFPRPTIPSRPSYPKSPFVFEPEKKKKKKPKVYYPFGKPKKRKYAYQPSAGAVALRITARKIPKKLFTGIELRPVILKRGQKLPFL